MKGVEDCICNLEDATCDPMCKWCIVTNGDCDPDPEQREMEDAFDGALSDE
jgi:hypothetical protein